MLLQLFQHLLNGLHVLFSFAFGIDENVIKVYYHKNIELLYQDLINVALENGLCIDQSKKHHLVLEIAIAGPKGCFPLIAFSDPNPMVGIE